MAGAKKKVTCSQPGGKVAHIYRSLFADLLQSAAPLKGCFIDSWICLKTTRVWQEYAANKSITFFAAHQHHQQPPETCFTDHDSARMPALSILAMPVFIQIWQGPSASQQLLLSGQKQKQNTAMAQAIAIDSKLSAGMQVCTSTVWAICTSLPCADSED